MPRDEGYRTCAECGGDCVPEPGGADSLGIRIMYVCLVHGVHSVVDPSRASADDHRQSTPRFRYAQDLRHHLSNIADCTAAIHSGELAPESDRTSPLLYGDRESVPVHSVRARVHGELEVALRGVDLPGWWLRISLVRFDVCLHSP